MAQGHNSAIMPNCAYKYLSRLPEKPTKALPKSEQKLKVFQMRLELGQSLFHPDDLQPDDRIHLQRPVSTKAFLSLDNVIVDDDDDDIDDLNDVA